MISRRESYCSPSRRPPPHRAEHVGIVVGPDPLVLVGLSQRPLF